MKKEKIHNIIRKIKTKTTRDSLTFIKPTESEKNKL